MKLNKVPDLCVKITHEIQGQRYQEEIRQSVA